MKVFNNEKLKKLRLEKGLSSRRFSFELYKDQGKGIASQTLDKWENGKTVPNFNNAILIADYFGLQIQDFIKETK